jgi:hypothetical protein
MRPGLESSTHYFSCSGDVDINTSDTSTSTHNQISGLIIRARARLLNNQTMETCILFCCLKTTDKNEIELYSHQLHSDSRTATVCDGRPTTYGLGLRCAITFWKAPGVYIHMHQTSSPYHVRGGRNHYFGAEIYFCQWCCDTLFWPIGPFFMLSPIWIRPRVGARPNLPEVVLPLL